MLLAGHPVRVSVVHPGGVRTGIATTALADAQRQGLAVRPKHLERARVYNEKLLRMPPDKAVSIILDGVEASRPRILVGADARIVDLIVRFAPSRYLGLAVRAERRLFPSG
ncbi:SDR family oxidoreductase [Streptomyces dysideae]|uniref:Uncharacterized protein n=1 Tax=Streptomyces dysideae TaxID=909626 RepID=A0A101UTC2_9ACTN|nr:hypothetical protein [Streptomyces dysideae]KUO16478.1 hypothetical protein AQJ91_35840 [Streptomyces dysideae]